MKTNDYRAILSAVEQALAICDRNQDSLDDVRRKVCEELRRVRAELNQQLGASPESAS